MIIAILIALLVGILVLGGGLLVWFVARQKQQSSRPERTARPAMQEERRAFRFGNAMLPVGILLLSVLLAAVFFPRLPSELAYHFAPDGSPDRWLGRGQFITAMLVSQFLLTMLAIGLTWGLARLSVRLPPSVRPGISVEGVVRLMGNMIALPQIVLSFAMLDVFSYNSFQVRIISFWVLALIVMIAGVIILGIFFRKLMKQRAGAS